MNNKDVLTYYINETNCTPINFVLLENGGVNILNSYEVNDDLVKLHFLRYLNIQFATINFKKRDPYSLLKEWKAHNILYNKKLFRKRTVDTNLDPNESWIRRVFYTIVCTIFKEK